jgi:hypothetical protein
MSTSEASSKTIEDLAALQAKSFELHAAYFSTVGKHLAEDYAEIAEIGRNCLEALAKADSFSAAFKIGVDFEDSARERLKDIVEVNATALKVLGEELTSLYKLTPAGEDSVKAAVAKKAPAKAKAAATA